MEFSFGPRKLGSLLFLLLSLQSFARAKGYDEVCHFRASESIPIKHRYGKIRVVINAIGTADGIFQYAGNWTQRIEKIEYISNQKLAGIGSNLNLTELQRQSLPSFEFFPGKNVGNSESNVILSTDLFQRDVFVFGNGKDLPHVTLFIWRNEAGERILAAGKLDGLRFSCIASDLATGK